MPLIKLGNDNELVLKIPSKGDIDWAEDFKLYFADPIVHHDHSGINGMGVKLTAASLEDGAIQPQHINFGLSDLNDVTVAGEPGPNSYLKYVNGYWQPVSSTDDGTSSVSDTSASGAGGVGDDDSGINLDENADVFITEEYDPVTGQGSWGGNDTLDFSQRNEADGYKTTGVQFIIDVPDPAGKKVKFANLKDCVIISNVDIEVTGVLDKCIIVMENDDTTPGSEGCNLYLQSASTGPIVNACDIRADSIEVSGASTVQKKLFRDSEIRVKDLNFQLQAATINSIIIERSLVDVSNQIGNSNDLSTATGIKFQLDNSKVSCASFNSNFSGAVNSTATNVDGESEFKQISSNYVKIWNGSRWNYLVSPSGINKFITADASGVPTEFTLSNGHVLKGGASGFTSEEFKFANLDDVNTSGLATNEPLVWNGSQFVPGPALSGTNTINTTGGGISITSTPTTGQYLAWNGSAFVPTTMQQEQRMLQQYLKFERKFSSDGGATYTSTDMNGNSLTFVSSVPDGEYYTIDKIIVLAQDGYTSFAIRASYDALIDNGVPSTGGISELVEYVGDNTITPAAGLSSNVLSINKDSEYTVASLGSGDQTHRIYTRNNDATWKIYPGQKLSMMATASSFTPPSYEWAEYIIYMTRHYIG